MNNIPLRVHELLSETATLAKQIGTADKNAESSILSELARLNARIIDIRRDLQASEIDSMWKAVAVRDHAINLAARGQVREAIEMVQILDKHRTQFGEAVVYIAEMPMTQQDIELLLRVSSPLTKVNARLLANIARAQAAVGDKAAAATFKQALEAADKAPKGLSGNKYLAYAYIAQAQRKAGMAAGSKETFEKSKSMTTHLAHGHMLPDAFIVIAKAQAQVGEIDGSKVTISQAKELVTSLEPALRSIAFGRIGLLEATLGDRQASMQTFKTAIGDAQSLSPSQKANFLLRIAEYQLMSNETEESLKTTGHALEALNQIEGFERDVGLLRTIALFINASATKKAMPIIGHSVLDRDKAKGMNCILSEIINEKERQRYKETFEEFAKTANTIKNRILIFSDKPVAITHTQALEETAVVLSILGDISGALEIVASFEQLRDTDKLKKRAELYQQGVLKRIGVSLVKNADYDGFMKVTSLMKTQYISGDWARGIASSAAKQGKASWAINWSKSEMPLHIKAHILLGVANGLLNSKSVGVHQYSLPQLDWLEPPIPESKYRQLVCN